MPDNDHGNSYNITRSDILKAMVAGKVVDMGAVINNIEQTWASCVDPDFEDHDGYLEPDADDDDKEYAKHNGGVPQASAPTADKGDGPGTVPNDPNYLRNNTEYINRPGGM